MRSVIKIIKNSHRHPVNQALHCIGTPFYAIGAAMIAGYFADVHTDLAMGALMWFTAIAMFIVGHKIENNLRSMTPVLLFRLILRKASNYFVTQRVHFLRT